MESEPETGSANVPVDMASSAFYAGDMPLEYTIEPKQSLVKVTVSGKLDYLSLDKLWKDIVTACVANDCKKILGIADIDAPSSSDAYDHAAVLEVAGLTSDYRVAWVELNPEAREAASLAEAVIRNRALAIARTFASESLARKWLATATDDYE